jgi:hypothetical protein
MFTEGSSPAALVGYGPAAVAACRGREASSARVAGRPGVAHGEGSSIPYVEQHEARNSLFQKRKNRIATALPGVSTGFSTRFCVRQIVVPVFLFVGSVMPCPRRHRPSRNARMLASEARRAAGLVNRDVVVAGQVGP